MSKKADDKHENDVPTTGHSWDGIEEYDNPMPRWWLYTFYACIVWGIGYTIAYPAWPMINQATSGLLGYSTRGALAEDLQSAEAANAAINEQLVSVALTEVSADPQLQQYAVNMGAAVFRTNCSQCHGSGAAGAVGFPNLLDDAWLWGGTVDAIHDTIAHGIRNEDDPDARYSEMPAFGEILSGEEIEQVAHYVYTIGGRDPLNADLAAAGEETFLYECAACHMDDGSGNVDLGAPALNDAIWLYGGDIDTIIETVTYSRFGVMPAWGLRLTDAEVAAVATYVHGLGGGVTEAE
ncbi:cytochrome-c oxidase, cbb3-type subunit III [Meridianimarinicoccus aquatilis]|uniref:Cbb3-type cytochrome c oxidase subunit n=1 Tax=Meridianimarinicoccus aquatilis TaxID=2552766 RepID=A0A4R6APR1_9RHOB|nr:cytochrome-c oxidase, cbb3-type subunit III [Fluviibacterium aquatile]QIE42706.1 cytochrome-c oxidase, cbb3-type subunit III [Rhodobacteraceae bacterium SC52]TDL85525.1 cytochrome-c oxidase, cbb3-type subunit III [Fluviibacterium aquatile]